MTDQPYQLLPPLTADEYTALRADIEAHGIRVPVDVDEHGQVLDGHHRQQIAEDLGIDCPTRVVAGLTEEEKRHHAVAVNAHRRMLTRAQRRALVVAELERDPSRSDRAIGRVCGVDHKTVGAIRRGGWGVPHPEVPQPETDRATLARIEAGIDGSLRTLDGQIIVMLLGGKTPGEVVGWLATLWHRFEVEAAGQGEEFLGPVRKVLYTDRVGAVLEWPGGWYGEECRREPDELRTIYLTTTGGAA
ncbi:ParB N-terminal domain-containing protein [Verrucosispora sp. WMMD1129]|uniref:ParB N-terminal domain-containing protein n=1 Tax=Verrucosispora sp. WMMD1129 TaxID=3016093 RepID=UPI00249CDF3C|nr:ParB N-terminal domain-containing protein [Verrucosispora sp. WMMD1129]WFE44278.1 ParB N-terminal domain-containing protein [Verrucosispora sp. WMMD1129]